MQFTNDLILNSNSSIMSNFVHVNAPFSDFDLVKQFTVWWPSWPSCSWVCLQCFETCGSLGRQYLICLVSVHHILLLLKEKWGLIDVGLSDFFSCRLSWFTVLESKKSLLTMISEKHASLMATDPHKDCLYCNYCPHKNRPIIDRSRNAPERKTNSYSSNNIWPGISDGNVSGIW